MNNATSSNQPWLFKIKAKLALGGLYIAIGKSELL